MTLGAHDANTDASVQVSNASWGYRIHEVGSSSQRIFQAAGRFVGLVLLLVTAGVWSFAGDAFADPLLMAMKLGITGLLFVLGWMLYWYGRDARQMEAQVDIENRELRTGYKDGFNRFRSETCIPFNDIGSFLILRAQDGSQEAGLYARIGSGMEAYEVIPGSEVALQPIQAQLVKDLSAARRLPTLERRTMIPMSGKAISLARVAPQ